MSKRKNKTEKPVPKKTNNKHKILYLSIIGVLVLTIIGLVLWMQFRPEKPEPEPIKRFPDIEHISTSIYKVLIDPTDTEVENLKDKEKEQYEKLEETLKYDVYVYIYNADYEESSTSELLEQLVIDTHNKEDKNYTLLVLNYVDNEEVVDLLDEHYLPEDPVLVHITGQSVAENGISTNYLAIQSVLVTLKGE